MNRRDFFRKLSMLTGAVLFAPVLNSCASPEETPTQPHPTPTITPDSGVTRTAEATETTSPTAPSGAEPAPGTVALVATQDRADGVRRAMALLDFNPVRDKNVLLKPNFNSADPSPGSTHLDTLRTLITELTAMGAQAITMADRSGMGSTRGVMQQIGVFDLGEELGIAIQPLDELGADEWVIQQLPGHHWARGYPVPRMLLEAECVVQTCNLKTHGYGGHFSMALKNAVGFVAKRVHGDSYDYMNEMHRSPDMRRMIAEINTCYTPALIVLDGVEAFVDGGPARGTRVSSGVVLAGADRVAIDAVGVAILRLFGTTPEVSTGRVFEQAQIARAVELGLGIGSPEQIAMITDDDASEDYANRVRDVLFA